MYKIRPYTSSTRNRDLFDVFDDFFSSSRDYNGNMKVDVQNFDKEYIVEADLPGISKEDIEIHFENERLNISVNRNTENTSENEHYIHRERCCESLSRTIYLKDVDPKKFKATLENGVLKVVAQKQEDKINKYMIEIE